MKMTDHFKTQLTGAILALAVVLLAARAGAETVPQVIQVIQVKGNARCATDNKTWHALKQGDILQPGVVIQTALHATVDIQLVDREGAAAFQSMSQGGAASEFAPPPSNLASASEEAKSNIIRIDESSVLAIDKLLVERTSVDEVAETQLDLRAGHIMGNVKKLSAASKYEIKIPNGVAGIRGSFYNLWATGKLNMLAGSAILALVGGDGVVKTWLINPSYGFNPVEGRIYPLSPEDSNLPGGPFPWFIRGNSGPPFIPPYCPPPISTVR